MTNLRYAPANYGTIERLAIPNRLPDRLHLPMIGFILGGGVGAVLWAGIVWGISALVS